MPRLACLMLFLIMLTSIPAIGNPWTAGESAEGTETQAKESCCPSTPTTSFPTSSPLIALDDVTPVKEPIALDGDMKIQMDALVGVGEVRSVKPEDVPGSLKQQTTGTRGTRASTHHEPDHQGQYYNNDVSNAEYIDWTPGTEVTYDGTTGDQPCLWVNWSEDKENPGYANYVPRLL